MTLPGWVSAGLKVGPKIGPKIANVLVHLLSLVLAFVFGAPCLFVCVCARASLLVSEVCSTVGRRTVLFAVVASFVPLVPVSSAEQQGERSGQKKKLPVLLVVTCFLFLSETSLAKRRAEKLGVVWYPDPGQSFVGGAGSPELPKAFPELPQNFLRDSVYNLFVFPCCRS